MALGQLTRVARLLDREPPRSVRSLKVLEPIDRNPRSASCELQQARLALRRPCADAFPEPLNDLIVHLVAAVVGVL